MDYGPGYRVYYAMINRARALLLCGGDQPRQSRDISRAVELWNEYRESTKPDET